MAVKELAKTPAGRYRRAVKDLARVGVQAELLTACCRFCADEKEGTTLTAVELDGTVNERLGWFQPLDKRAGNFSAYLNWSLPEGQTIAGFLNLVSSCLVLQGFIVEPPTSLSQAIKVTARV